MSFSHALKSQVAVGDRNLTSHAMGATRPACVAMSALALVAFAMNWSVCAEGDAVVKSNASVEFSALEQRRLFQHASAEPRAADPSNRVSDNPKAMDFGRSLFFERRFSSNGNVACATCHDHNRSWCDNGAVGVGIAKTRRNVPALYDVSSQRWFFWDGRADSLWSQALGPLENPSEHNGDRIGIMRLLATEPGLRTTYEELFDALPTRQELERFPKHGTPLRDSGHEYALAWSSLSERDRDLVNTVFANAGKSIAAFVGTIRSGESSFDVFVRGLRNDDRVKMSAISDAAQRGAKLFVGKANCRTCHSGRSFSDGEFHSLGMSARDAEQFVDSGRLYGISHLMSDPFNQKGKYSDLGEERGHAAVDHLIVDGSKWGQFKTPTLRNVARTAPYMHDGRFRTLREVVEYYSTLKGAAVLDHHEEAVLAPLRLAEHEINDLVSFLETLTEARPFDETSAGTPAEATEN
jgi:cytochrome c peroxidase